LTGTASVWTDDPLGDRDVVLRVWRSADAEWYAARTRDPEIQRWTSEPPDLSPERVREAIEAMLATRAHLGTAITDAGTGQLLGNAGLALVDGEPGVGAISYWLAPEGRGRGAATRAVRLLTGWAWACGLRRVELFTHVDNLASQGVAERAGFVRERVVPKYRVINGEPWDAVIYGLARDAAR
jgi:ribosomal-protein-alanine N-acetyltransferase